MGSLLSSLRQISLVFHEADPFATPIIRWCFFSLEMIYPKALFTQLTSLP